MDLFSVGNLNRYITRLKLQTQWTLKQQSGNYTAKGKTLEDWLDGCEIEKAAAEACQSDTLREIHQKLDAGGKLTAEERTYLQTHDPQSYQELVNQEREQKAYEQALRRCRTQEEVDRLRVTQLNTSLVRIRAVESNPNIPLSKKLEIATAEKRRTDRIAESTRKFVASGAYAQLPTRAEESKASEDAREETPETPRPAQPENGAAASEPAQQPHRPQSGADDPALDLESPEERKVRRARAKAAYAAAQPDPPPAAGQVEVQA